MRYNCSDNSVGDKRLPSYRVLNLNEEVSLCYVSSVCAAKSLQIHIGSTVLRRHYALAEVHQPYSFNGCLSNFHINGHNILSTPVARRYDLVPNEDRCFVSAEIISMDFP